MADSLILPAERRLWYPAIWAHACCPADKHLRQELLERLVDEALEIEDGGDRAGKPGKRKRSPEIFLQRELRKYVRDGNLAGAILAGITLRDESKADTIRRFMGDVDQDGRVVDRRSSPGLLYQHGWRVGITEDSLERAWARYRCVSHLWAAVKAWNATPRPLRKALRAMGLDGIMLLDLACEFRDGALLKVAKHAHSPVVKLSDFVELPTV